MIFGKILFSNQWSAITIPVSFGDDHDKINQCPYAETSKSEQLDNGYTGFPGVKVMSAKCAEKKTQ